MNIMDINNHNATEQSLLVVFLKEPPASDQNADYQDLWSHSVTFIDGINLSDGWTGATRPGIMEIETRVNFFL